MAIGALKWDQTGERVYETGDKNVALYIYRDVATTPTGASSTTHYPEGIAWNGITAITESPSGAEANDLWADDRKYATLRSAEQFGGTIEAYTYPDEWEECDGSKTVGAVTLGQQTRRAFGLAWISTVGNDTELNDYGEKLHLIYNATVSPAERSYATINDSPEAITFSWEFSTTPLEVGEIGGVNYKELSLLTIDTAKQKRKYTKAGDTAGWESFLTKYNAFKKVVFGDTASTAHLPEPGDVISYFSDTTSIYTYTVLSTKPDDWDTNYMDYYTRSGSAPNYTYTKVSYNADGVDFTANTYYKRSLNS